MRDAYALAQGRGVEPDLPRAPSLLEEADSDGMFTDAVERVREMPERGAWYQVLVV